MNIAHINACSLRCSPAYCSSRTVLREPEIAALWEAFQKQAAFLAKKTFDDLLCLPERLIIFLC